MCLHFNIYKLYTIGDCYVAIGIVDAMKRNYAEEAKNVVDFGFSLLNIIDKVK